jgi:dihydropteroate synthase
VAITRPVRSRRRLRPPDHRLIDEGAHIIDIGAESSRPGAHPVAARDEAERLLPVVEAMRDCGVPVSVDTVKPEVMRAVLAAGADMINDINALRAPGALEAVATTRAGICLMHMQGEPATMQSDPQYDDVVAEVAGFLGERVAAAEAAGIALNRITVDPGFGFGKSLEHNIELLRRLGELVVPGLPLLVGMSRKSMLGLITGAPRRNVSMLALPHICWQYCAARASCACMMWRRHATHSPYCKLWRTTDVSQVFRHRRCARSGWRGTDHA